MGREEGASSRPAALSDFSTCISGTAPELNSTPPPSRQLLNILQVPGPCQAVGAVGKYRETVSIDSASMFPGGINCQQVFVYPLPLPGGRHGAGFF